MASAAPHSAWHTTLTAAKISQDIIDDDSVTFWRDPILFTPHSDTNEYNSEHSKTFQLTRVYIPWFCGHAPLKAQLRIARDSLIQHWETTHGKRLTQIALQASHCATLPLFNIDNAYRVTTFIDRLKLHSLMKRIEEHISGVLYAKMFQQADVTPLTEQASFSFDLLKVQKNADGTNEEPFSKDHLVQSLKIVTGYPDLVADRVLCRIAEAFKNKNLIDDDLRIDARDIRKFACIELKILGGRLRPPENLNTLDKFLIRCITAYDRMQDIPPEVYARCFHQLTGFIPPPRPTTLSALHASSYIHYDTSSPKNRRRQRGATA